MKKNEIQKEREDRVWTRYVSDLANDVLLAGIELGALVDVAAAGVAANTHGKHHPHLDLLVLLPPHPRKLRWIEVRRVILVQNFTLSHLLPPTLLSPSSSTHTRRKDSPMEENTPKARSRKRSARGGDGRARGDRGGNCSQKLGYEVVRSLLQPLLPTHPGKEGNIYIYIRPN